MTVPERLTSNNFAARSVSDEWSVNPPSISKFGRSLAALIAMIGWWALIADVMLTLKEPSWRGAHVWDAVWYLSGYFTMLTNFFVAVVMTALSFNAWPRFAPSLAPALAFLMVYIVAVGLLYDILLSGRWHPVGWAKTVDDTLHNTIPVMTFVFWVFWAPKSGLRYWQALYWLVYPLVYFVVTMVRGATSGWYPYPFLDVRRIGIEHVLLNSMALSTCLLIAGFSLIALTRSIEKRSQD